MKLKNIVLVLAYFVGPGFSALQDGSTKINLHTDLTAPGGNKMKRQTIKDLINKRNQNNKIPSKRITLLTTGKPTITFKPKKYNMEKVPIKSRTPGMLDSNKQTPRFKEIGDRIKDLKARLSIKPKFQSRSAFAEADKSKNPIEQLKDRRQEIIKDLKALHSKSLVSDDTNNLKERVGSVNYLQNQIDKIKQKTNERNKESDSNKNKNNIDIVERVGSSQSSTTEILKSTSHIPVIVFGQTEKSTSDAVDSDENLSNSEVIVLEKPSANKSSSASSTLNKIKDRQKEAVTKIKDKLSVKSKRHNVEIFDVSKPS